MNTYNISLLKYQCTFRSIYSCIGTCMLFRVSSRGETLNYKQSASRFEVARHVKTVIRIIIILSYRVNKVVGPNNIICQHSTMFKQRMLFSNGMHSYRWIQKYDRDGMILVYPYFVHSMPSMIRPGNRNQSPLHVMWFISSFLWLTILHSIYYMYKISGY